MLALVDMRTRATCALALMTVAMPASTWNAVMRAYARAQARKYSNVLRQCDDASMTHFHLARNHATLANVQYNRYTDQKFVA